eukprot:gene460-1102_t
MSDESVYYSPGEVDSTEATDDSDIEIRKNLLSAFDNEPLRKPKPGKLSDREPMKVYLRIRPFTPEEIKNKEDQSCVEYLDDQKSILLRAPQDSFTFKIRGIAEQTHKFSFSKVFNDNTCQKEFFDNSMLGYVKDFLDGTNTLIFTYGVTNSGKTYTIQGSPKNGGVLPRTLDVLFNSIRDKQYNTMNIKPKMYQDVTKLSKDQQKYEEAVKNAIMNAGQKENIDLSILWKTDITMSSDASIISSASSTSTYATANEPPDYSSIAEELKERVCDGTVIDVKSQGPVKFCIWVSFAEIYNEYCYDLLDPTPMGKGKKRNILKLSEDMKKNPYIKGLKEIQVNSADEAFKVLRVGQKNQNIAVTKLNQNSSRSHSIFTIKILRIVDVDDPHVVRISRLSFVDLAGSERYCKTQSTGDRLKEASNINTSIMTLGKCIECLRYNQLHKNHPMVVPYRENKLTRLFQGFFRGKGKVCMIVNVSKCGAMFDETFNVLKFSAVAKEVTTKAGRNTDIFKPKSIPKPNIAVATPVINADKKNWAHMGLTTPRPVQKTILTESMCEENDQIQGLVKSYEELRKLLIDERRKNAVMELKIREEVCAEMSEQIVEIEKNYSDRLQEEQQCLEEQCEKRIELLTKSMKKSRKRKKIDRIETEDDSYVSSVLLHAEKVKVKERDETILQLRAKLAEKEISHEFFKQTHTPEQQPKAIANLESELEEAKETLRRQEENIVGLQTTLNFTKDEVEEKDMQIEKMKEMMESEASGDANEILAMKDLLLKTSTALNEARVKLDARDLKIKECNVRIRQLEEKMSKASKGVATPEIDQFERDLARLEEQTKISHQRNEFQAEEIRQLRSEREELANEKKAIVDKVGELKRQLEESEERREQLLSRDEDMKNKIRRFENVIKNHETALAESEGLIEQLNENIREYGDRDSLDSDSKNTQVHGNLIKEKEMVIQSLEIKLNDCKRRMAQMEEDNGEVKELVENYCKRVSKYEDMLQQKDNAFESEKKRWCEELAMLEEDKVTTAGVEDKLNDIEKTLEECRETIRMKEDEIVKLKEEVQRCGKENEELRWEKEELEVAKEEHLKVIEEQGKALVKEKEVEIEIARMKSEAQGYEEHNQKLRGLEEVVRGLEEERKGLEEELRITCEEKQSILKSKETAVLMLEEYEGEIQRLRNEVEGHDELKERLVDSEKMVEKCGKIEKTLGETLKALDKKNEQVIGKNNKIEKLVEEVGQLKEVIHVKENKCEELETRCREYEVENEMQSTCFEKQRDRNAELLAEKDELLTKLNGELDNVKLELEEKSNELEEALMDCEKTAELEKRAAEQMYRVQIEEKDQELLALREETIHYNEKISSLNEVITELEKKSEEVQELKTKLNDANDALMSVESRKEELQDSLKETEENLTNLEASLRDEIKKLTRDSVQLKTINQGLEAELERKEQVVNAISSERNSLMNEKADIETELVRARERISSLDGKLKLRTAESKFNEKQTKQQVNNALYEVASKKEDARLQEVECRVNEHCSMLETQNEVIKEQRIEIEELKQQAENQQKEKQESLRDKQLIHELRCSSMQAEEELNSLTKKHDDTLEELEQIKCECLNLSHEKEELKSSLIEREEQIAKARKEVERLQEHVAQLQRERERFQSTPCQSEVEMKKRRSSDVPLAELKEIINSSNKKRFNDDGEAEVFSSAKLRRSSRRVLSSSSKKENSTSNLEQVELSEESASSQKGRKGRKVLYDINERSTVETESKETTDSTVTTKKRRRKLMSRVTGSSGDSPQVIPATPTEPTDPINSIVQRHLRSSSRR